LVLGVAQNALGRPFNILQTSVLLGFGARVLGLESLFRILDQLLIRQSAWKCPAAGEQGIARTTAPRNDARPPVCSGPCAWGHGARDPAWCADRCPYRQGRGRRSAATCAVKPLSRRCLPRTWHPMAQTVTPTGAQSSLPHPCLSILMSVSAPRCFQALPDKSGVFRVDRITNARRILGSGFHPVQYLGSQPSDSAGSNTAPRGEELARCIPIDRGTRQTSLQRNRFDVP
jgi:hypothetical protein